MSNITPLPAAPVLGSETFETQAGKFLDAMPLFSQELDALVDNVSAKATTASASAATAVTNAATAVSSAATAVTNAATAVSSAATAVTNSISAGASAAQSSASQASAAAQASAATSSAAAATAAAVGASNIVLGVSTLLPVVRPSLNLDFANSQTVDSRITFTRASTATRVNERGLIESVLSGVPRIDFDPVTLECKGLLIEEQRTNLLTYSEQFDNAAWTKTRCSATANAVASPDGTVTADKLVEDSTATNTHLVVSSAITIVTATAYTFSVFAKVGERTKLNVDLTTGWAASSDVTFDLIAVTATPTGTATGTITSYGNGWYRLTVTATSTGISGNVNVSLHDGTSLTYTGNGASGLYIWGAQLEAGAFATSYIPTVASQVTRPADVVSITGTNFSSWYNQSEGSFVVKSDVYKVNNATPSNTMAVRSDVNTFAIIKMFRPTGLGGVTCYDITSALSAELMLGSGTNNYPATCAMAYKVNDFSASLNGSAVVVDNSGSLVSNCSTLYIGSDSFTVISGHISRLSYYPKRLTNAELQSLSQG